MRLSLLPLVCAWLFLGCRRDEPIADGRPLSHWVGEARQGSVMPWWNSSKDERRAAAFRRLTEIGEPAVPALLELLRDSRAFVSGDALNALAALGPRAASAVPELQSMLGGGDPELRLYAAMLLGGIGPRAAPAVPALTAALRDPDPRVSRAAAEALANIGGSGQGALDRATRDSEVTVRASALDGISEARLGPAESRRYLEAALDDPSPAVRARGVEMLFRRQGGLAEESADLMVRAMNDTSALVRAAARQAYIGTVQHRSSPRLLVAVLKGGDADSRADAAWRLAEMLRRSFERERFAAEQADIAAALGGALRDEDVTVRIYAVRALAAVEGADRARLAAVLRAEIPRAETDVALRGAGVLWDLTRRLEDVRPAFVAGLAAENRWTRLEALAEIMELGAAAAPLAPAVERLRDDPDRDVRARAERVLAAISAPPSR